MEHQASLRHLHRLHRGCLLHCPFGLLPLLYCLTLNGLFGCLLRGHMHAAGAGRTGHTRSVRNAAYRSFALLDQLRVATIKAACL